MLFKLILCRLAAGEAIEICLDLPVSIPCVSYQTMIAYFVECPIRVGPFVVIDVIGPETVLILCCLLLIVEEL